MKCCAKYPSHLDDLIRTIAGPKNLCYAFIYTDGALLRVWWTLDGPRNVLPGRLLHKPKVTIVHEVFSSDM